MTEYRVIVEDGSFNYRFDGEPQINLTFEHEGTVYKIVTRAHDEGGNGEADGAAPMLHAEAV